MDPITLVIVIAVAILFLAGALVGLLRGRGRGSAPSAPRPGTDYAPGVGDDATPPRDAPKRDIQDVAVLDREPAVVEPELEPLPALERPAPAGGRLHRLRARLARSNSTFGQGLLALLSRDHIDDETWDEVEETLLGADLGVGPTTELIERLRTEVRVDGIADPEQLRGVLRRELVALVDPTMDRSLALDAAVGRPAVVLVVGVNGTGKTTTVGKLARVLVAEDRDVLLGAADTFRAAAADQLQTWGSRVGVPTVRSDRDGADPAAVAFDAVSAGIDAEVDVVLIDTAGRLQNKAGLMDELGKVKRVIEKRSPVDEVLLVLDATTGQNGMRQAQVFSEVVNITGIVLTKLDGTAKGGIVVAVQRALGVPVKLVGLGEGPDDLAPFDAEEFVDALLA
ncbi:signal recognition particle-docking protein FtsY [Angustibacter sp. Root456]|uniref:signal recognition particle-docking protein FtsY n=1 Tax=Angustibacter sp. Root456 TaxID=1736539 RepID=UPI0006F6C77E|nr:signal recognition particle-docking protein FtsY [Angustibacter sp. Root456]KQX69560.1 signal recognition particle-docking protein FtsY [Angustibacter sp. Root456]